MWIRNRTSLSICWLAAVTACAGERAPQEAAEDAQVVAQAAGAADLERFIGPADVERIGALTGVVRRPAMFGRQLEFALAADTVNPVLIVQLQPGVRDPGSFASFRQTMGPETPTVPGIGDEAFALPAWRSIVFRKGERTIQLIGGVNPADGQPFLSEAQLEDLARTVAARL